MGNVIVKEIAAKRHKKHKKEDGKTSRKDARVTVNGSAFAGYGAIRQPPDYGGQDFGDLSRIALRSAAHLSSLTAFSMRRARVSRVLAPSIDTTIACFLL
jgi:hypothetical protein